MTSTKRIPTNLDLHIGRRKTGVSVSPDAVHAKMWRVHHGDRVSDMTNIARAKDAAITWAQPRGLGSTDVAHWHNREAAPEAPYSDLNLAGLAEAT
jgi:hypothetical protein